MREAGRHAVIAGPGRSMVQAQAARPVRPILGARRNGRSGAARDGVSRVRPFAFSVRPGRNRPGGSGISADRVSTERDRRHVPGGAGRFSRVAGAERNPECGAEPVSRAWFPPHGFRRPDARVSTEAGGGQRAAEARQSGRLPRVAGARRNRESAAGCSPVSGACASYPRLPAPRPQGLHRNNRRPARRRSQAKRPITPSRGRKAKSRVRGRLQSCLRRLASHPRLPAPRPQLLHRNNRWPARRRSQAKRPVTPSRGRKTKSRVRGRLQSCSRRLASPRLPAPRPQLLHRNNRWPVRRRSPVNQPIRSSRGRKAKSRVRGRLQSCLRRLASSPRLPAPRPQLLHRNNRWPARRRSQAKRPVTPSRGRKAKSRVRGKLQSCLRRRASSLRLPAPRPQLLHRNNRWPARRRSQVNQPIRSSRGRKTKSRVRGRLQSCLRRRLPPRGFRRPDPSFSTETTGGRHAVEAR